MLIYVLNKCILMSGSLLDWCISKSLRCIIVKYQSDTMDMCEVPGVH